MYLQILKELVGFLAAILVFIAVFSDGHSIQLPVDGINVLSVQLTHALNPSVVERFTGRVPLDVKRPLYVLVKDSIYK